MQMAQPTLTAIPECYSSVTLLDLFIAGHVFYVEFYSPLAKEAACQEMQITNSILYTLIVPL